MYKYSINIIFLLLIFSGCAKQKPDFTIKKYTNISKDAILNAAKKVIKLSDKRFNISSYIDKIEAKRAIAKYKAFDVDLVINTIILETKSVENITEVKLIIKQKKDYFDSSEHTIKNGTHQLMWNRIDYILGLNNQWPSCISHSLKLNLDGVLCNRIHNQNNKIHKFDRLQDSILYKKDIKKEKKSILKNIDLDILNNITLPKDKNSSNINLYNDRNNSIIEINLDDLE